MPNKNLLLVLIVREAGLRSTLSARLSLAGADVVTARDIHDPALERGVREPTALVLDEALVAERSDEWLDAVLAQKRWCAVIVICRGEPAGGETRDPRLVYLSRAAAVGEIVARFEAWKRDPH